MENLENLENMVNVVNVVNMIRPRWLFFVKQIEAFHPMNSTAKSCREPPAGGHVVLFLKL
jgi:hypothetical protein